MFFLDGEIDGFIDDGVAVFASLEAAADEVTPVEHVEAVLVDDGGVASLRGGAECSRLQPTTPSLLDGEAVEDVEEEEGDGEAAGGGGKDGLGYSVSIAGGV